MVERKAGLWDNEWAVSRAVKLALMRAVEMDSMMVEQRAPLMVDHLVEQRAPW